MPIDYLNQIATAPKKPGIDRKMLLGISVGAVLLIILIIVIVAASSGKSDSLQTLALRLQTTQKIASTAQKDIKSSSLRTINSSLGVYLTNTNRNIVEPLAKNKIDLKKVDKKTLAAESGTELSAILAEAKLNVKFDSTYAREMSYRLEKISVLMNTSYKTAKSTSLKTFLESSDKDLQVLKKEFADFNSSQE